MNDDDLVNFFKKNNGNVCGRFANDQLNTDIRIPAKKIPWLKYFFTIAIPAFLFSQKGNAQTNTIKGKVACVETKPNINRTVGEIYIVVNKVIRGKIISEKGEPLSYASVTIKGLGKGVVADTTGNFKIDFPIEHQVLVFSAVGYSPVEIDCSSKVSTDPLLVKMSDNGIVTTMGISVRTIKKTSSIPVIPDHIFVSSNIFSIFPNPVSANSTVNIRWNHNISADQSVEIYNQAGNLLQQGVIRVNKKNNQQSFALKPFPSGGYIIKITDSKTQKSSSQQFIVD